MKISNLLNDSNINPEELNSERSAKKQKTQELAKKINIDALLNPSIEQDSKAEATTTSEPHIIDAEVIQMHVPRPSYTLTLTKKNISALLANADHTLNADVRKLFTEKLQLNKASVDCDAIFEILQHQQQFDFARANFARHAVDSLKGKIRTDIMKSFNNDAFKKQYSDQLLHLFEGCTSKKASEYCDSVLIASGKQTVVFSEKAHLLPFFNN